MAAVSLAIFSSSLASRAFSAPKSMTPSSGRATVASSRTICAEAFGTMSSKPMDDRRARRMISFSQASARRRVSLLAETITQAILAPAGTFISARTERTSEMKRITHSISASAAASPRPL